MPYSGIITHMYIEVKEGFENGGKFIAYSLSWVHKFGLLASCNELKYIFGCRFPHLRSLIAICNILQQLTVQSETHAN